MLIFSKAAFRIQNARQCQGRGVGRRKRHHDRHERDDLLPERALHESAERDVPLPRLSGAVRARAHRARAIFPKQKTGGAACSAACFFARRARGGRTHGRPARRAGRGCAFQAEKTYISGRSSHKTARRCYTETAKAIKIRPGTPPDPVGLTLRDALCPRETAQGAGKETEGGDR